MNLGCRNKESEFEEKKGIRTVFWVEGKELNLFIIMRKISKLK